MNGHTAPLLGGKFKVLTSTDQIKELQTIIRDKDTSRSDFKFVADRLIRMVIEEGLNQLPYQDCCRSMRIGKILVDSDVETHEAHVVFAKFPDDISSRKVLLLYPIMSSGNKVLLLYPIMSS